MSEETTKQRSLIPADLNEGQQEAYIQMRAFIEAHGQSMYLLEGYAGTGKAQPLHSKILTPNGWVQMGDIKRNDIIVAADGTHTNVLNVFPQGKREIFKIGFSDGSSTECCGSHLWAVKNYINRNFRNKKGDKVDKPWEIKSLDELGDLVYSGRANYNIPLVSPVNLSNTNLLLDPYFLGLILGDGCITQNVSFSSSDIELLDYVETSISSFGCTLTKNIKKNGHIEGHIVYKKGVKNPIKKINEELGIQGLNSKTKFIPNNYLFASLDDRISLLQGLLDTDGNYSKTTTSYCTASVQLRDGVIELVQSMGGIASYTSKIPKYKYKDVIKNGAIAYNVIINLPEGINPFRLNRKAQLYKHNTRDVPTRYISSVTPLGWKDCQCIMIDHQDHLYVTDDYIVTHNTYLVGKILRYVKDKHPNWRIAVTAPTNKAVKVLMRSGSMNDSKVKFQTIHKLLGLKEEITADGKQIFVRNKYEECSIEEHHVIIIDEVSMLNDDLFQEIQQYAGIVKIIFMGDPAQIPPVGREDCIPFKEEGRDKYKIQRYLLTEIMRQTEGNPILAAGFALREDLNNPSSPIPPVTDLTSEGHGLDFVKFSEPAGRNRLSELLEEYFVCQKFKDNSDYAKVIAWRNKTILKLNHIIRALIYKAQHTEGIPIGKIMDGEKLVANKPIVDKYNIMLFTTNDEFEVVESEVCHRTIASETDSIRLKYYLATVEYFDVRGSRQRRKIDILHEESVDSFDLVLTGLKKYAISKNGYDAKKAWVKYYGFMRQFADVGYNYAITAHKCVHEDSNILTNNGWVKIKDVCIGDMVWSQNSFQKILNQWKSEKSGLRITTRTGRTLICSDEHQVKQQKNTPYFVTSDTLVVGDTLLTPRLSPEQQENNDLMWLYGVILGDGSFADNMKKDGRIEIAFNKHETVLIEKIIKVATKYVGRVPTIRKKSLYWNSRDFHKNLLFAGYGYDNKIKYMPGNITIGVSSILLGLMDADGSVDTRIRFVNTSKQIIDTMQRLFLQLGIISIIKHSHKAGTYTQNDKVYNKKNAYTLTISCPDSVKQYRQHIGFTDPSKTEKLEKLAGNQQRGKTNIDFIPKGLLNCFKTYIAHELKAQTLTSKKGQGFMGSIHAKTFKWVFYSNNNNYTYKHLDALIVACNDLYIKIPNNIKEFITNHYFFDPITTIEKIEKTNMVDIEVENTHEFNCEGFSVHNCQGSTYENVFVIEDDIDTNQNVFERNRIKYTTYTRPTNKLFVIKS